MNPDAQYAAMAAELAPCCEYKESSHEGSCYPDRDQHVSWCPASLQPAIAAALQSVATASHKAGAEAMREKAADVVSQAVEVHRAMADRLSGDGNTDAAIRNRRAQHSLEDVLGYIRALTLPTGEQ